MKKHNLQGNCSVSVWTNTRRCAVLTGRTIKSGFPCVPPTPSPPAALRIISLACVRLALLSAPIWPSWIRARLNGLNVGAGGMVDIYATPLKVTDCTRIGCERRDRNNVRPRQQSMILTRLEVLLRADSANRGAVSHVKRVRIVDRTDHSLLMLGDLSIRIQISRLELNVINSQVVSSDKDTSICLTNMILAYHNSGSEFCSTLGQKCVIPRRPTAQRSVLYACVSLNQ